MFVRFPGVIQLCAWNRLLPSLHLADCLHSSFKPKSGVTFSHLPWGAIPFSAGWIVCPGSTRYRCQSVIIIANVSLHCHCLYSCHWRLLENRHHLILWPLCLAAWQHIAVNEWCSEWIKSIWNKLIFYTDLRKISFIVLLWLSWAISRWYWPTGENRLIKLSKCLQKMPSVYGISNLAEFKAKAWVGKEWH